MPVSFAEFISFQMISFYGAKSIATRFLQEMYVGLAPKRKLHPRLSLFARALQVSLRSRLKPECSLPPSCC